MFDSWLTPAPQPDDTFPAHSLGKKLTLGPERCNVGLIGLDRKAARRTREYLYAMAWDFDHLSITDLGDLRKTTNDFAIPLLRELHTSGITPILIGCSDQLLTAQYLAFNELNRQVNLLSVDSQVQLSATEPERRLALDAAVYRKERGTFHLTHVGGQQHLVDPALWSLFDANNYEAIRLGEARASVAELEPQIRDADLLGFNIRALNHYDAPARARIQPSGFDLQEASQLAYYAGNSDKLSSFGLYGMHAKDHTETEVNLTAASYAQLIWYFLLGHSRRVGDFPLDTTGFKEYVVDMRGDISLRFFRSPVTQRWWCELPPSETKGEERNRYVACSNQDYLTATQEQILPNRLVRAFRRYG